MTRIYTSSDREIKCKVGEPFALELKSNPTTGYTWNLALEESAIEIAGHEFVGESGQMGAASTERFILKPKEPKETKIRAEYRRQWETTPIEVYEFHVAIRR